MNPTTDLVLTGIVAGALVTVAGLLYNQLLNRVRRAEDQVDRYHGMFGKVADGVEGIARDMGEVLRLLREKN